MQKEELRARAEHLAAAGGIHEEAMGQMDLLLEENLEEAKRQLDEWEAIARGLQAA